MKVFPSNLSEFLSQNSSSFYIPPFQRSYSWTRQEIERYYDDVVRIIESEKNPEELDKQEHFFGVLVIKNEKSGLATTAVIVDGQQRITTTLLLLIALRNLANDDTIQMQIENVFLKNPSSTFTDKIKLKQVTDDWDAYRALINKSEPVPGKITDGYNCFAEKIKFSNYSIEDYVHALSKINLAYIDLDERPHKGEDPQIIFETLNSLGKPLSFADLIRNYVMLGLPSHDQTEIYDDIWYPKIESVLHERASYFFRDFMQYKESKAYKVVSDNNTKELYVQFRKFVDKHYQGDKKKFAKDIQRYVELYRWIDEAEPRAIIAHNTTDNIVIIELLRNIFHDIRADAFKPFVLGLLEFHHYGFEEKKLPDSQLIDTLSAIRTYLIRRRILRLTQGENKEIPQLCDSIYVHRDVWFSNAKSMMFKLLSDSFYSMRMPNDAEIKEESKRIDFYNGLRKYSKLILGKIEEYCSKVSVNYRDRKITIEHIMPQTFTVEWKQETGDDWEAIQKRFLHNIGNLILTEFNSEMGNKSLGEKKTKLERSNLYYRHDVLNRETWNEYDMIAHQSNMIERLLQTFPLPFEMQNAENWNNSKQSIIHDIISPLDDDSHEVVTGRSPKAVLISDELFEAASWQEVYLVFLRWLSKNKQIAFANLLNQTDGNGRFLILAPKSRIITLIEEEWGQTDSQILRRYKRLADGVILENVTAETEEEPLYVHINASAASFVSRIRETMQQADMTEESVTIELWGT
ncbi:MAG: DUF262 domain-containing HNH endonuclease family protein [Oscillospiraceae bacterium]|jgi:uncharacterized protein with ParB-like and HNH nuclease domain|nr:DUF262 domain-containing HNH endonuclease family protein [Oscillospiraceae bacterium]